MIFTGLAVAVAFRCGLFNIGAEGQLYVASFATAWVGIKFGGTVVDIFGKQEDWSWTSLAGVFAGSAVYFDGDCCRRICGARFREFCGQNSVHREVINTIMLNFIGIALVSYFTQYHYKVPGDAILETAPIGKAAYIPQFQRIFFRLFRMTFRSISRF